MTLAWCSRIKSLFLSSAHTLFSLAPAHVASLTSSQFQLPCPFYLLHHWESLTGATWFSSSSLPGKFLPTLPNSAETSPILWRFSPTIPTELCSSLCFVNTHTSGFSSWPHYTRYLPTTGQVKASSLQTSWPTASMASAQGPVLQAALRQTRPLLLSAD